MHAFNQFDFFWIVEYKLVKNASRESVESFWINEGNILCRILVYVL